MASASPDPDLAPALAAWLGAIDATEKGLAFSSAVENCVAPCRVFSMFAPELLSEKDYFVPAKVSGTNASRQRRYNVRRLARSLAEWFDVSSRASSPVNSASPIPTKSTLKLSEGAKSRIKTITDAARSEREEFDAECLLLALCECLLCAAVNSSQKKMFVEAILNLSTAHQDSLANSIRRTMAEHDEPAHQPVLKPVLAEVSRNVENTAPAVNNMVSSSPMVKTPVKSAQKPHISTDLLSAPRGIPPAEFKALAEERDSLRRKLASMEQEKNSALESAVACRRDLEEASDRIRSIQATFAEKETELEQKTAALSEAKACLRETQLSTEEMDVLRAKAASTEQLEASLKRASKRLEEVADMRKTIKDLETQNAAYRDNEERMGKQIAYLETQLKSSNDRAQSLVEVSDTISHELEAKTGEIRDITSKNQELMQKLATANDQLTSMLMQPESSPRKSDKSDAAAQEFNTELISARLYEEVGVSMAWADIVDCIRGVVEAMNEMDEMQRKEQQMNGEELPEGFTQSNYSRRSSAFSGSDGGSYTSGSYASVHEGDQPKVEVLPDFKLVDSKREEQRGDLGDQFDYAVDHANVMEIPVMNRRPSQLSTVPEDREGFESEEDDVPEPEPYIPNDLPQPQGSPTQHEVRDISSTIQMQPYAGYSDANHEDGTNDVKVVAVRGAPPASPSSSAANLHHVTPHHASNSLSVCIRPNTDTSPLSENTKTMVRQTRSELHTIQHTLDTMRTERESSSLTALIEQLNEARSEVRRIQRIVVEKEVECETLRHDLDSLIKEHDTALKERAEHRERDLEVLREKERVIKLLETTVKAKDAELEGLRESTNAVRSTADKMRDVEIQLASAAHEHSVMVRAQEVEIARLTAKLEASELIAGKLGAAMDKTDGLTEEIHRARESYFQDIAEAARRDKEAAETARTETQRAAEENAKALSDLKAVQARTPSVCCSDSVRKARRSNRIGTFWRKMLHLDAGSFDQQNGSVGGLASPTRMSTMPASQSAVHHRTPVWDP